ncbi:hypothetical protein [Flavihumibacter fluvii]|uniref:hypothetical protein n=1 Tax=Flavihumibacter fluvii TaxID=2838157 RepID=UPI001BDDEBA9|nr:hypothetical protein [Flavihumibacter fluvii]ULQ53040.1 hypothetical protein KJS93_01755 [Flavihumibacter fluvii]
MANRILKGAHISERKFRELVKLFSEDLTATQISSITSLSRITINQYLKKIREAIALHCELQAQNTWPQKGKWPMSSRYGIIRSNQRLSAIPLSTEQQYNSCPDFIAIADFKSWKLFRLPENLDANGRPVMDQMSAFWGLTKNRLHKFRGLHAASIYLHVKECEFRYNYRHHNLNELLLEILLKN